MSYQMLLYHLSGVDFSWRSKNVMPPIVDQGQCSSCAPIATVTVLSAHLAIALHCDEPPYILSQQNVMDNVEFDDDGGCSPNDCWNYIKNHGVCLEEECPYIFTKNSNPTIPRGVRVTCKSIGRLPQMDFNAIRDIIFSRGPIVVALPKTREFDMHTGWGILHISRSIVDEMRRQSAGQSAGHVVTAFGFDTNGGNSLVIQNSQGTPWGVWGCGRVSFDSFLNLNLFPRDTEMIFRDKALNDN